MQKYSKMYKTKFKNKCNQNILKTYFVMLKFHMQTRYCVDFIEQFYIFRCLLFILSAVRNIISMHDLTLSPTQCENIRFFANRKYSMQFTWIPLIKQKNDNAIHTPPHTHTHNAENAICEWKLLCVSERLPISGETKIIPSYIVFGFRALLSVAQTSPHTPLWPGFVLFFISHFHLQHAKWINKAMWLGLQKDAAGNGPIFGMKM